MNKSSNNILNKCSKFLSSNYKQGSKLTWTFFRTANQVLYFHLSREISVSILASHNTSMSGLTMTSLSIMAVGDAPSSVVQ
jgi:hypothetical protein